MRKIQKILIGVFIGGVLMGGVGTGIAFVEYSSFAYAGEKKVGEEHLVTRQLDHTFDPARGRVAVGAGWAWEEYGHDQLIADASVPENVIRYEVTYNEKVVRPYLIYDELEEETEPEDTGEPEIPEASDSSEDIGSTPPSGEDKPVRGQSGSQDRSQDKIQGRIFLSTRYIGNDLAFWMECKDDFLQELKQKKISYYDLVYLTEVKIKVNPATLPYVEGLSE